MSDSEHASCMLPEKGEASQSDDGTVGQPSGQFEDQGEGARIYGKEGCPHTLRARKALPQAVFIDVLDEDANPQALADMLALSGGVRRVPVIVRAGGVQIGYRRGS